MSKNKFLLIITGVISLALYSCSNNITPIGAQLVGSDLVNLQTLDSYTDSLRQTSTYFKSSVNLSSSSYIFLGKKNNAQASSLIKFSVSLPDSINQDLAANNAHVISSKITLPTGYTYVDSNASLDFNVYKITNVWTSTTYTANNISSLAFDPVDVSSNRVVTDSLTTFNISNSLSTSWLIAAADSVDSTIYGIYLVPTSGSQKILGYTTSTSTTTSNISLQLVIQKPGDYTDTTTFYPLQDASVITGILPSVSHEDIVVQAGVEINSKLWFDVSKIPANAVVNYADLTLTADSSAQLFGSTFYNALLASNLADSASALPDSSSASLYNIMLSLTGNQYVGNVTPIVQKWISSKNNQGLLLEADGNLLGLELFALKGSSASNLQLRPRLRITYTTRK
ncbi:MAG: hypothetical protein ACYDA4_03020 [Ignavibacteriaceae bacterium]